MKKTLILCLLLGVAVSTLAEEQSRSLYVTLKDGTKAEFSLATKPMVVPSAYDLTLHISWADNGASSSVSYNLLQVKNITFADASSDVRSLHQSAVGLQGDYFVVPESGASINVATAGGMVVAVETTQTGHSTMLDLRQLKRGLYIITYKGQSFKLQRP